MLRPAMHSPFWARIGRRGPQILFSFCLATILICFWRGEFSLAPGGKWGGFEFANVTTHRNHTAPTNSTILTNDTALVNATSIATNKTTNPYPKPDGIFVSGLVFYGRRDRVSIMVTYLEVGHQPCFHQYSRPSNNHSATWWIMEDGLTRSSGSPIPMTRPISSTSIL